ncbi:MAG: fatty acid desaturase [Pseudomonadota bacterium]
MSKDEWPTLGLLLLCYLAFALITMFAEALTIPLAVLLLAPVIALHSSLQHEVVHGHPFADARANGALVFPALGLFIPYIRFKDIHIAHHYDPNLTDPYEDPETNFLDPVVWETLPGWRRRLLEFNNTLLGRMALGPMISLITLYTDDFAALWRGERRVILAYTLHVLGLLPPVLWVLGWGALPLLAYAISAYLGFSLLKIRTFLEHQAHDRAAARSVIIEDRGPLALLFLNNNYHAVHHAHPGVAWPRLPRRFAARRARFLARDGGYAYRS